MKIIPTVVSRKIIPVVAATAIGTGAMFANSNTATKCCERDYNKIETADLPTEKIIQKRNSRKT